MKQNHVRNVLKQVDWLSAYIISESSGFSDYTKAIPIPTLPSSVSEGVSLNTNEQAIVARWAPIITYMNTNARTVSFNFSIADDYMPDGFNLHSYVNALKSLEYPNYSGSNIISPQCILHLANITLKGIVTSVNVNWGGPVAPVNYSAYNTNKEPGKGTFTRAEISLQFKEVSNTVKGSVQIKKGE